uniref:Uncharacterized protein n=1 Tax=Rhizophora mucronata TaxID=61149 RepID=A0A2P2MYY3_RHIMU
MADKPSRALVLYGDGLARFIDPSHTHLHTLASKAACGFLILPNAPPSESEDERIVREFAHLSAACEAYQNVNSQNTTLMPSISERFMGMKAAIITDNAPLKSFGGKLGFTVLSFGDLNENNDSLSASSVDCVTSRLLKLLGFQEGKILEASQFDLVFVHIGAGERDNGESCKATANDSEYMNALVGSVMHKAQPGSEIGSHLHLSVVMSYGSVTHVDNTNLSILISKDNMHPELSMLLPRQSYTMKGEKSRIDVRHHSPMLVAQWQYAVTRLDETDTFSFENFKEHGGNLGIPADRFLHEVAFKLWKAPKYGA